ncbi:MAG: arginase family protein [Halobacteriales archaeon]
MGFPEYPEWDEVQEQTLSGATVPMIDPDQPTFMRRPYAYSKDQLEDADVAIIGAPYVQAGSDTYGGIPLEEWVQGPKRVRQQSAKYGSGRLSAFDVDVFEHLTVVDYGDADIPEEIIESYPPNVEQVLEAQRAVERKVTDVLEADAIPIVIGQNSPAGSYAVAKPILERTAGDVGMISLDTHWDARDIDGLTMDERIAGGGNWLAKLYEWHDNARLEDLVEIGVRGFEDALDDWSIARESNFYPMFDVKDQGINHICEELDHAYDGTDATYLHFDMDVMGGGGSAPGDLLGRLAEPMGMSDYEILKLSHEIGKRGFDALSFIAIMPGSAVMYRTVAYVIMYMLAGKVLAEKY